MNMYIVGPSDTKEHERWSSELEKLLEVDLNDFPLHLPVQAEELSAQILPLVENGVKLALRFATERRHLERVSTIQFSLFLSHPGVSGLLTFSYRVDLDLFSVRCIGYDGMIGASAVRPER